MSKADDEVVFDRAAEESRIIISGDTDFGALLASRHKRNPSFILFQRGSERLPQKQVLLLLKNLRAVEEALNIGNAVVFEHTRIRIRALPIGGEGDS